MKKIRLICAFILVGALCLDCSGSAFAASKRSLAVMDFEGIGVSDIERQVILERFRAELSRTDHFVVLDSRQMAHGLEKGPRDYVSIGNALSVDRLVVGSVSKIGTTFSVVCNLIDATSGQTVKTVIEDYKGSIDALLQEGVRSMAQRLADFEGTGYLAFVGPRKNDTIDRLSVWIDGQRLRAFPKGDFVLLSRVPAGSHTLKLEWHRPGINGRHPPYMVNVRPGQVITIETNAIRYKPTLRVSQPVGTKSIEEWHKVYWPEVFPDKRYVRGKPASLIELEFDSAK